MKVAETLNTEMRPGIWKSFAYIMFVYRYCLNINLSQILYLCTGTACMFEIFCEYYVCVGNPTA
jgi:hypothetical protein